LLVALRGVGFDLCVATPHMRPGMFDNTADELRAAFVATQAALAGTAGLPEIALSSEHFFDDVVFERFMTGQALPYPGGHAPAVDFPTTVFPTGAPPRFFNLRMKKPRPVLAPPERYEPVWRDPAALDPLVDGGALMLLDVAALAGKYGRRPRQAAER